jgi:hypothetical protein
METSVEAVTVQLPVPLHAPDHPLKIEPAEAVAWMVKVVPAGTETEQSEEQACPSGPDTVPDPCPEKCTATTTCASCVNPALQAVDASAARTNLRKQRLRL